jgi:hypothetical protein
MNQYIITEHELRTLTECANMGFGILVDNTAMCVRSHLYQPERDVKELFRKEIAKWKEEDPLFMAYVYGQESGRKDERDTVLELLDGLRKYANGEYKEADLSDNEHDLRIHLEYENRIWGIMKELRQQAGEP